MVQTPLENALNELLRDPQDVTLSTSILGTSDTAQITHDLEAFCHVAFGIGIASCLYAGFSVGAAFGIALVDGREVFIKIHKPTCPNAVNQISLDSLTSISTVQQRLVATGFPAPPVVRPPTKFRNHLVTVDKFVSPGEQKDAHQPIIRERMATTLAELVRRTEAYHDVPNLPRGGFFSAHNLYPIPHNALFDFESTARGADWIDVIARRTKAHVGGFQGRTVLGHMDWSLKHFQFQDADVVIIYDWDSLALDDELNLLGLAAATFPTTWDIPVKITPSQEESYQFVMEYEHSRRKPFSEPELSKISSSITYTMAYIARCEHALDPDGKNWDGSFRQSLESMVGPDYLSLKSASHR